MQNPIYSRLLVAAAIVVSTAPAQADGQFYGRLSAGASTLSDPDVVGAISGEASFGTGQAFGGALGYDYAGSPFRSEIEYIYRTADADPFGGSGGGDLASTTVALNGYYDFATAGSIAPYLGAGVGYATEIDFDIGSGTGEGEYSDTGIPMFQLMAGARYPINDRFSLTAELRYFDAGSVTLVQSGGTGTLDLDYSGVEVSVGLQVSF
ncbi:outer membrane protein [Tropicimonas sp. S265A]|uniref:outer membrane protein n=1 Tax=Tropicimonas sp. S265A TaxID=3415134 RepID=UPI003C7A1E22